MFQYAAGRRLAHVRRTGLRLDISWFGSQSLRRYELGRFNIKERFASPKDIAFFTDYPRTRVGKRLRKLAESLIPSMRRRGINEPHFHFAPAVLTLPRHSLLHGYWQSEKYFGDISHIIRKEFTLGEDLNGRNAGMAGTLRSTGSVSVHVRRADYVADPVTNKVHGICELRYYERAIELIASRVGDPHFYIFSDDMQWAKSNLNVPYAVTYMDQNPPDAAHIDMCLMSLCKHNIVANSSFSWWAAWLNSNPDKIVIAPERWFLAPELDTKDLVPPEWIRLPNDY